MQQRFSFLILIIYCFIGCKKEESSDPNQEKLSLLTSKTWKVSLIDDNPSSNPTGTLTYDAPQQCELDDSYKFGTDNQLAVNNGESRCNTNDAATSTTGYSVDIDAKKISINGITYTLQELSETQLKYTAAIPYSANYGANIVFIFKH